MKTLLTTILAVSTLMANAQFPLNHMNWGVPAKGENHVGLYQLQDSSMLNEIDSSVTWGLRDFNGDGKLDLAITSQVIYSSIEDGQAFKVGNTFYWKVYLNSGSGFNANHKLWQLPHGGRYLNNPFTPLSFNNVSELHRGEKIIGDMWDCVDINGDGKDDLVVFGGSASQGNWNVYHDNGKPLWRVFINDGTRFKSPREQWFIPKLGLESYQNIMGMPFSTKATLGKGEKNGTNNWDFRDINGDNKPDIVVTAEVQNGKMTVFKQGNKPYWKVYLNTGSGFNLTPITWFVPNTGKNYKGDNLGLYSTKAEDFLYDDYPTSVYWNLKDMDGDNKQDLVVTAQKNNTHVMVLDSTLGHYWRVYLNNGNAFAETPLMWRVPYGGDRKAYTGGFYLLEETEDIDVDDNNSQMWFTEDMNKDKMPDLVVCSEKINGLFQPFEKDGKKHWIVYFNIGNEFTYKQYFWQIPDGTGHKNQGKQHGYCRKYDRYTNYENQGSQFWETLDLNGNGVQDLVVTSELNGLDCSVFGLGGATHWRYYDGRAPVAVSKLELSTSTGLHEVHVGDSVQLITKLTPSFATIKEVAFMMDFKSGKAALIQNKVFIGEKPGLVRVIAYSNDAFEAADTLDITVLPKKEPVSVANVANNNRINIFPNPSSGVIGIQSDIEIKRISVWDLNGKELMVKEYKQPVNDPFLKIDVQSGIYWLKIESSLGKTFNKKLIIH